MVALQGREQVIFAMKDLENPIIQTIPSLDSQRKTNGQESPRSCWRLPKCSIYPNPKPSSLLKV